MANLVTTSATWTGKQNLDYFIKPLYEGKSPLETMGVQIIPNVKSTLKLNYFDRTGKHLIAYTKGFTGSTGLTMTQRDLTVKEHKAEFSQDAYAFAQTIFEEGLRTGVDWNKIEGTVLEEIIVQIFGSGTTRDIFRLFWLGDTDHTTVDSSGQFTGTANQYYNSMDGILKYLRSAASTSAVSSTSTHIYRKEMAHNATAQVSTVTTTSVASAGGNLVLTVNGTAYSQVYATSLTATAAAFVTAHAATILAKHKVTVTSTGAALTFTSAVKGMPHTIAIASASAVAASGGVVATTANVAPTALAADEALSYMQDLFVNSYPELISKPINEKVMLMDFGSYYNYLESLEDGGTYTDMGKGILINGLPVLSYRGVPVIPMDWQTDISADYADGYYTNHIIYTAVDNLVLGIDSADEFTKTEFWYNQDEQENRFRFQLKMGANYKHYKLTSVSY